ncbi:MAG TPA: ABC transporter substrate-binding protein [Candidatus Dormibacteraeota bacterium]|nr:ABC transporter substrate-binding protein [Candidatus Dormibacteraeota bacterium]
MHLWRTSCLAAIAVLVVAGCGNGTSGQSNGPPPHGNVLFYATPGEPGSLDPGASISGFDQYYTDSIYETLINSDSKTMQATRPGLATGWSFTGADKLTFRLNLRHGVKFQDGTPFNADAVKASLDHYKAAGAWFDLTPVKSETVVDDYTIDLNLSQQYSPLPAILSFRAGQIISPTALQKYGKDFGRHPVGAGPFSFVSWTAGSEIVLTRFKDYWNAAATRLAGIDYKVIVDPTAMTNAMAAGQVDLSELINLPVRNLAALQGNSRVTTRVLNTLSLGIVTTVNTMPPFNNVLVRRAANLAIDRQALSDAIVGKGHGQGPAWQYVPPNYWAATTSLKDFGYHPDQAKELLRQAGYSNGVTVQICTFSDSTTQAATIQKEQMAPAGFNLQISQEPVNSCVSKLQTGGIPMVEIGWFFLASPFQGYQTMFGAQASGPRYAGVDDLLARIASQYTQPDQKPYYDQLNELLYQTAPSVPTYWLVNPVAYSTRLTGLVTDINGGVRINQASFQ